MYFKAAKEAVKLIQERNPDYTFDVTPSKLETFLNTSDEELDAQELVCRTNYVERAVKAKYLMEQHPHLTKMQCCIIANIKTGQVDASPVLLYYWSIMS